MSRRRSILQLMRAPGRRRRFLKSRSRTAASGFFSKATSSIISTQARMPSFSGTWPRIESPRLLAREEERPRAQELAEVLEADRRLARLRAVGLGHGVDEMRGHDRAGHLALQAAVDDEMLVGQRDDLVGRDPDAACVNDAEAVAVAVAGKPRWTTSVS